MHGRKKKIQLHIVCSVLIIALMLMAGCGEAGRSPMEDASSKEGDKPSVTGIVMQKAGTFDSADTAAIVVAVDSGKKTCTLYNRTVGRSYTLNYDGTSKIYDKYGSSTVIDNVSPGDVVDVTFLKTKKLLNSLTKSADTWVYDDVDNFELDALNKHITIDGGDYRFKDDLLVFADGTKAQLMDINSCDRLKICGYEHTVYSIVIEQGHGYLRLKGQDYFEGGWIEVGSKIIKTVSKDMLLAVPVGNYRIKLSNGKYEGERDVVIEANKETMLDVSDMVIIDNTLYGTVILVTDPMTAEVYVDGKEADASKPLSLEYGIHQFMVRAPGYETLTQYVKVGQESATLEISLDVQKDYTATAAPLLSVTPTVSAAPQASASVTPQASVTPVVTPTASPASTEQAATPSVTQAAEPVDTSDYRVYIESPQDVEVFVDGSYVGIVPISFAKKEGTHVVTLRRDGYITRSYTIALDSAMRNETFSFASLESID